MTNTWAGALLEVRGVRVRVGRERTALLHAVDLTLEPRSWTAILGPNGAGKSTLLRAMAGLVRYDGSVLLDGGDVAQLSARGRARQIGYAPQAPNMPGGTSVADYLLLGRAPYDSVFSGPSEADRAVVAHLLQRMDLAALARRRLGTLSAGERQCVVLARALAPQPRLLLLDEPTATLDLGRAQHVLDLIDMLRREEGVTVASVLHDFSLAAQYAERLVFLAKGTLDSAGSAMARVH